MTGAFRDVPARESLPDTERTDLLRHARYRYGHLWRQSIVRRPSKAASFKAGDFRTKDIMDRAENCGRFVPIMSCQ